MESQRESTPPEADPLNASRHCNPREGDIFLHTFEKAIRSARRAKACSIDHAKGRWLITKLEHLIDAEGLTVNPLYVSIFF